MCEGKGPSTAVISANAVIIAIISIAIFFCIVRKH